MDELESAARMINDVVKTVREEVEKQTSLVQAGAEARQIEADGRAKQQELAGEASEAPHLAGAGTDLPPEAQVDGPWTFGRPDAADVPNPLDWEGFLPGHTTHG